MPDKDPTQPIPVTPLPRERLSYFDPEETEYAFIPEIDADIVLDEMPFLTDPLSPTPLDPHYLSTVEGIKYYDAALELMLDRLERRFAVMDLDEESKDLIRKEIEMYHQKRCLKNKQALERLREGITQKPELLTPELKGSIKRARSAQAGLIDNLEILSTYPEIGSIGGIQATVPFNVALMNGIASQNKKDIIGELWAQGIDFTILNADTTYKTPSGVKDTAVSPFSIGPNIESLAEAVQRYAELVEKQSLQPFVITEKPILEIRYKGARIEMVEGMNPFVMPADKQLQGVTPNPVFIPNKGKVNMQNISYFTFFRVIPNETSEMLFVDTHPEDAGEDRLIG